MNCSWPLPCTPANLQVGSVGFWMLVPFQITTGSQMERNPRKTEVLIALLRHLHIFLPPWALFTQNLPKTESPGQHKGQLTRWGICIVVKLKIFFPKLLLAEHQHSTDPKMGKSCLKPHSARYQTLVFLSVRALPSYLSVLYRTAWITTFMIHCPLNM